MNFQLFNDKVWTFPLKCANSIGPQPFPTAPAAVSSNSASLGASVASGPFNVGFVLTLTPKVQVSPGLTVTVSSVGADPTTFVVDVVVDPDRLAVSVDSTAATTVVQNVPVAPGP